MAVILIHNGFLGGALAGMQMNRSRNSFTPTDYANDVNVAEAFAQECLTRNAVPVAGGAMADADNANIFLVCFAAAYAVTAGVMLNDTVQADVIAQANNAVALAKQSVAKLT